MTEKEINRVCMEMKYSGKAQRHSEQKAKSARRRDECRKKEARRMEIIRSYGYAPGVGWIKVGRGGAQYVAYSGRSNMQRFLKRQASKKARRSELPARGNGYRRVFDYQWQLW